MSEGREAVNDRDEAGRLLGSAAARASAAATDLFLPKRFRLTEWQRRTMADLFAKLVRAIEDGLRAALADRFEGEQYEAVHAALTSARVEIALPILKRARGIGDDELVTILMRRSEEHRLRLHADAALRPAREPVLLALIRDADEIVAAEAMALVIAGARRFDLFDEPAMARTELPADIEHRLTWTVAAALRHYLIAQHDIAGEAADEAIAAAAVRLIAGYDEADALEARCMRLARRLWETKRLDDDLLEGLAADGGLPLFLAAIAARTALPFAAAWEIFADPSRRGGALLLLAADIARPQAASIMLSLAAPGETVHGVAATDVTEQLDLYDMTDGFEARAALRLWQVDPAYRAAISRISPRADAP